MSRRKRSENKRANETWISVQKSTRHSKGFSGDGYATWISENVGKPHRPPRILRLIGFVRNIRVIQRMCPLCRAKKLYQCKILFTKYRACDNDKCNFVEYLVPKRK